MCLKRLRSSAWEQIWNSISNAQSSSPEPAASLLPALGWCWGRHKSQASDREDLQPYRQPSIKAQPTAQHTPHHTTPHHTAAQRRAEQRTHTSCSSPLPSASLLPVLLRPSTPVLPKNFMHVFPRGGLLFLVCDPPCHSSFRSSLSLLLCTLFISCLETTHTNTHCNGLDLTPKEYSVRGGGLLCLALSFISFQSFRTITNTPVHSVTTSKCIKKNI